ncbi:MAG TPA: GTP cyclohydrolase II [Pyrinomonadaceae bacterium]|nr:GTP cyclohydrolase II [Pyrinomonadaceae bacterium]
MSSNAKPATSTVMRVRDCRSTYPREPRRVLNPNARPRLLRSATVERVAAARLPTECGEFRIIGYRSLISNEEFVVLAQGEFSKDRPTLVRIHSQCLTGDVFGSRKCDCGQQLRKSMEMIAREGCGAIVYQQQEGRGIGIINKIRAYALQDDGADTIEANEMLGLAVDLRCYEQCAEILRDLGLNCVRLMSNNPEKMQALEQMGVKVVERVSLLISPAEAARSYLRTKKERMGHLLEMA